MIRETVTEGPSVAEALDAALEEMGVQQDAVKYEVLAEPGRGFLGAGARSAKVRVWLIDDTALKAAAAGSPEEEPGEEELLDEELPASLRAETPELSDEQLDALAAYLATVKPPPKQAPSRKK